MLIADAHPLMIVCSPDLQPPSAASILYDMEVPRFPWSQTGAGACRSRRPTQAGGFSDSNPQHGSLFIPPVSLSEKTLTNKVEYRRKSADLLCQNVMHLRL